jgi:hypothetical protein
MPEHSTMTVEDLEARRRQLAYEVGQGREDLEPELDAIEDQLARLRRHQERAELAQAEGATRAQEKARAETERQQAEMAAKLEALFGARLEAAALVESAMARLEEAVSGYLAVGHDLYSVSAAAGRPRPRLRGDDALAAFISWRLAGHMPHSFHRPQDHASRRSLVEVLGGTPTAPSVEASSKVKRGRL